MRTLCRLAALGLLAACAAPDSGGGGTGGAAGGAGSGGGSGGSGGGGGGSGGEAGGGGSGGEAGGGGSGGEAGGGGGGAGSAGGGSGGSGGAPVDLPTALRGQVEEARYLADLGFLAAEREPGSAHWAAVQDLCATRFEELGFQVERHAYATGVNVVGIRTGAERPAERVVVSAHYDHIPGCAGADDNASGVAGVLEAARVLSAGTFGRTLVVACWDEEELGLLGSRAYTARAAAAGEQVVASFVLEMIGYRSDEPGSQDVPAGFDALFPAQLAELQARDHRGDFLAVIPDPLSATAASALEVHAAAVGLPVITLDFAEGLTDLIANSDLGRSDHAAFWLEGFPAMMLTDTANFRNPNYHCAAGPDAAELLDPHFAAQVVQATVGAAAEQLSPL